MSETSPSSAHAATTAAPRPSATERAARAEAEFEAGRYNPFASVDLSRLAPEIRARVAAWQRERGFTPTA